MKNHFMSPFAEAKGQIHNIIWGGLEIKDLKQLPPKFSTLYIKARKSEEKQHLVWLEKFTKNKVIATEYAKENRSVVFKSEISLILICFQKPKLFQGSKKAKLRSGAKNTRKN